MFGAAWVERGCEWMRGLGLGFTNHVGTGGLLDVCLCFGIVHVHDRTIKFDLLCLRTYHQI